jgi:putative ABC transport system permease protein
MADGEARLGARGTSGVRLRDALVVLVWLAAPSLAAATAEGPPSILLSRQLAEAAGLAPGDVAAFSAARDGSDPRPFRVLAIYEPTPDPMKLHRVRLEARFHLGDLQELVGAHDPAATEGVAAIRVELRDPGQGDAVREAVAARAPTLLVHDNAADPLAVRTFETLDRFHWAIAVVTVLGATTFLLALMVMRAEERRETIGILRLLGLGRGRILLAVLAEGALVAAAGALAGVVFAAAAEDAVNRFFQWHYDTALVFVRVTPAVAARCLALAVPLGIAASVVASWTLLRREVAALLRR